AMLAVPRDAGGATLTGRTVTWTSNNPSVVSVTSTGVATALAVGGPVTLTATSEGISGTGALTVVSSAVPSGLNVLTEHSFVQPEEDGWTIPNRSTWPPPDAFSNVSDATAPRSP